MNNISLETSVHWLSEDRVNFVIEVGVYEKFGSDFTKKSRLAATSTRVNVAWRR